MKFAQCVEFEYLFSGFLLLFCFGFFLLFCFFFDFFDFLSRTSSLCACFSVPVASRYSFCLQFISSTLNKNEENL